jgi:hypothetical protein
METFRVLVAEQDEKQFVIIQDAFTHNDENHFVVNTQDPKSLLQYLSGKIKYNHQLPDLLLFNSKCACIDGQHVLELISQNPFFSSIPAVEYTFRDDLAIQINRARAGKYDIESKTYASTNADLFVAELITFLVDIGSRSFSTK